jgi:hypothetical protein
MKNCVFEKADTSTVSAGMVVVLDVREDGVGGGQVVLHPGGGTGEGGQEGGEGDGPGPGRRAVQGQSQERQLPAHKQKLQWQHAGRQLHLGFIIQRNAENQRRINIRNQAIAFTPQLFVFERLIMTALTLRRQLNLGFIIR